MFQGKYEQADRLYIQAIEILERALGPDHPQVATGLSNRAGLLKSQVRAVRNVQFMGGSNLMVDSVVLGGRLPDIQPTSFAGEYDEAGPWYERSFVIGEKVLGADHPAVAIALNSWAGLLSVCSSAANSTHLDQL